MIRQRESNMELLRIIAMLMITWHHFLIGKYRGGIVYGNEFLDGWQWAVLLNGFVYVGVNVFVLISGYFGIKFKWKGVVNLLIFCAFYMLLNLLLQKYHGADYSITKIIYKSVIATTRTTKWFIPCYMALYFLSPLLNSARETLSKRQYLYALTILSVYCFWFGYMRHVSVFNQDGYTVGQFIWLYFIGGYIRRFNVVNDVRRYRRRCVCIWLLFSALWGGATIALYSGLPVQIFWHPITYNNPFTLIGSIAFFCLFTTFHFHSKVVNYIAKSVLAVYLFNGGIKPLGVLWNSVNSMSGVLWFVCGLGFVIARFVISIGIDQIRLVMMIPINKLWDRVEQYINLRINSKNE